MSRLDKIIAAELEAMQTMDEKAKMLMEIEHLNEVVRTQREYIDTTTEGGIHYIFIFKNFFLCESISKMCIMFNSGMRGAKAGLPELIPLPEEEEMASVSCYGILYMRAKLP